MSGVSPGERMGATGIFRCQEPITIVSELLPMYRLITTIWIYLFQKNSSGILECSLYRGSSHPAVK